MAEPNVQEHVELIREVFSYANRFQDSTFVIQVDYTILDHPYLPNLVKDLVLLKQAGINTILVPGAKGRIDDVLTRYGISWESRRGIRIATIEAIPFIKMAAFDTANSLLTLLTAHNANAVIGNWVKARARGVENGIDYHESGIVERIKINQLRAVLDQGIIPVFPCIGWSATGRPYNVSSRQLASTLASELHAEKLFFITDTAGLFGKDYVIPESVDMTADGRVSRMTVSEARDFLEANRGSEAETMYELVEYACASGVHGVERIHIVDGRIEGVILKEIFSNLGLGTMVHANIYQSVRTMRQEDVPDVYRLMGPLVEQGVLVQRTEEKLSEIYPDFVVYETDGTIHGCAALHQFPSGDAEIAGVAVDPRYSHLGIGHKLISFLVEKARRLGLGRVFVLTTSTSDWFDALGFREGSREDLPEDRRLRYDETRRSRIMALDLS
ncbi:MAG: amino-acid N-acetyltransferase [Spirochaetaceae bacterium]|nr:MAG: amino-acid N-acetyltransferase [Spirochaetaceae bacterium]